MLLGVFSSLGVPYSVKASTCLPLALRTSKTDPILPALAPQNSRALKSEAEVDKTQRIHFTFHLSLLPVIRTLWFPATYRQVLLVSVKQVECSQQTTNPNAGPCARTPESCDLTVPHHVLFFFFFPAPSLSRDGSFCPHPHGHAQATALSTYLTWQCL